MVLLRLMQSVAIEQWDTHEIAISLVLLSVFVIAVVAWSLADGTGDAERNPDSDHRDDLAMRWLLGGIFAGAVSGIAVCVISIFYSGVYVSSVLAELTTTAAFTALLVFAPAMLGVYVGRKLVDRKASRQAALARTDTDVFQAVREDQAPAGQTPEDQAPEAQKN
jgi:uncharacterized membrane protein YfcA